MTLCDQGPWTTGAAGTVINLTLRNSHSLFKEKEVTVFLKVPKGVFHVGICGVLNELKPCSVVPINFDYSSV